MTSHAFKAAAGFALALSLAACASLPDLPRGPWQERHAAAEAEREADRVEQGVETAWRSLTPTATPVALDAPAYEAADAEVRFAGGLHLTGDDRVTHSLSDIKFIDSTRFLVVHDEGLLVEGSVVLDGAGRLAGVGPLTYKALVDTAGQPLVEKRVTDAEGLALLPQGGFLVSFERDHRVWLYADRDAAAQPVASPDFAFTNNDGMEAIAYDGAGGYWAAGESGGIWRCSPEACRVVVPAPPTPLTDDQLRIVSMDRDPRGGALFVSQRAYDQTTGRTRVRISHWHLAEGGMGGGWTPLIDLTEPAAVDNFEGLAAVALPDGRVRLYLLSDDNFNAHQRTLLLAFDVP